MDTMELREFSGALEHVAIDVCTCRCGGKPYLFKHQSCHGLQETNSLILLCLVREAK
jgi:uncharacterized ParB-like nuclease family protein